MRNRGWRKFFNPHSITGFIFWISALIMALAAGIIVGIYQHNEDISLRKQVVEGYQITLTTLCGELNSNLEQAMVLCQKVAYNNQILQMLYHRFTLTPATLDHYQHTMVPLMNSISLNNKVNIYQLSVYMENETIPQGWPHFISASYVKEQDWYKRLASGEVDGLWLGETESYLFERKVKDDTPVITGVHAIRNYNGRFLGAVSIALRKSDLFKSLYEVGGQNSLYTILPDGTVDIPLIDMAPEKPQMLLRESLPGSESDILSDQYLYLYKTLTKYPITVVMVIDLHEINHQALIQMLQIIGLTILIIIVLCTILSFFLRRIFRTFDEILDVMRSISEGDMSRKLPVGGFPETKEIAIAFNELVGKSDRLINDLVHQEALQRDTQLQALQYQINPHFIYNTIDIIRMRLQMEGHSVAGSALGDFGKILRYNLSSKAKYATVAEELQQVRHFLNVQQVGYHTEIQLEVKADLGLMQDTVLKFLMQPLVENSIRHGLDPMRETLHIEISVKAQEEILLLDVWDDGVGIPQDEVEKINHQMLSDALLETGEDYPKGIGLNNINRRLVLFYGQAYHLEVESQLGEYTCIHLCIPRAQRRM